LNGTRASIGEPYNQLAVAEVPGQALHTLY
jgi:hypothetical protein